TWPGTKFIHGFNLGRNSTEAHAALPASVPYACKAIGQAGLLYWELGNEPDLFKTSAQGAVRPSTYDEAAYVKEWRKLTSKIQIAMLKPCPELARDLVYKYIAPSFAGTTNSLDPATVWKDGLSNDYNIGQISSHNYINGAEIPGVTLQGTLMNHTNTVASIAKQLALRNALSSYEIPFILGETNSLYNQGRPGLSNTFGAALWGLDFNLWCASQGIKRVHMHQGTNYRYASWQPIDTNLATKGTKAPYYGQIAVASMLGNLTAGDVQVANIAIKNDTGAVYAAYVDGKLARIMAINMVEYNSSSTVDRPLQTYSFSGPTSCAGSATVQRLIAEGADAISGITFNGYSYDLEAAGGEPKLSGNATKDEIVYVGSDGIFNIEVPYSSAAMVTLKCWSK
ncbi:hypothetical protein LTS18_011190, partial [Coniosporium uncinatum]